MPRGVLHLRSLKRSKTRSLGLALGRIVYMQMTIECRAEYSFMMETGVSNRVL